MLIEKMRQRTYIETYPIIVMKKIWNSHCSHVPDCDAYNVTLN